MSAINYTITKPLTSVIKLVVTVFAAIVISNTLTNNKTGASACIITGNDTSLKPLSTFKKSSCSNQPRLNQFVGDNPIEVGQLFIHDEIVLSNEIIVCLRNQNNLEATSRFTRAAKEKHHTNKMLQPKNKTGIIEDSLIAERKISRLMFIKTLLSINKVPV